MTAVSSKILSLSLSRTNICLSGKIGLKILWYEFGLDDITVRLIGVMSAQWLVLNAANKKSAVLHSL